MKKKQFNKKLGQSFMLTSDLVLLIIDNFTNKNGENNSTEEVTERIMKSKYAESFVKLLKVSQELLSVEIK